MWSATANPWDMDILQKNFWLKLSPYLVLLLLEALLEGNITYIFLVEVFIFKVVSSFHSLFGVSHPFAYH